ncbi:MAG TPA: substrate-binding domain-containing protein [Roseiflexaceae bacterium]|nr:substrate-binding domain-containing protein [Roseiflexaceae bacterium]
MSTRHNHRIGYVPYELFHSYWAICAQGAKTRAAELGIELVFPSTSADDDIQAAIDDLVAKHVEAVILPGNLVVVQRYSFEAFKAAAIPVIVAEFGPGPAFTCAVHANEFQGAAMVVDYLVQRMGGSGKIAHLVGGPTLRFDAFHRMLEREPRIELAFEAQGRWTREEGARMMRDALAMHTDLRGVFAHNDGLALGALDVIEEQGYTGQIEVVGFDGTPDGLAAVYQGKLAATVYRSTYTVGRMAVDMAVRAGRREPLPAEVQLDANLITPANIVEAALESMSLLPTILQDLLESNKAQVRLQHEIIAAQRSMIQELSTPIIPISDQIMVLPLIGTIDSARAHQIMESMLTTISQRQAAVLIIDITGVAVVDTSVAHHLLQAARAAQLLGTLVILVGISPEVAQTVVQLGVDLSGIPTYSSLQFGLEHARASLSQHKASEGR